MNLIARGIFTLTGIFATFTCLAQVETYPADSLAQHRAMENGHLVNEGLERCRLFVRGWLAHADPETGLIPRNLEEDNDIWNAKDAAADNYPFMVLTAALTDQELFEGTMRDMLSTEIAKTSRVSVMPDTYSFTRQGFETAQPNLEDVIFGSSEYIKDGLLPLTEWLGESPWSERMISILDAMWEHAPVETSYGKIVSTNVEVNGEMLQTLSRVYWMTGEQKYLDWAIRLGDYYLLDEHHPTRNSTSLRLRDHGCEIISGLCELYATVNTALPEKKQAYEAPLHAMLDRVLEVGRNTDGLFYNVVNPQTGEILDDQIADNFGYTLNGFYTVYQIDGTEKYRNATLKALNTLKNYYRNFQWEGNSADGYADAIEGALNLYAREPIPTVADWLDSEMRVMWAKQQDDGVIEGWHGDGNFARTTIMYCLWKTQGTVASPWRSDILLGANRSKGGLLVSIRVDEAWEGVLRFDSPRHETNMHLPLDWPRINQFPEWYVTEEGAQYEFTNSQKRETKIYSGEQLQAGVQVSAEKGINSFIIRKISR
ncbi:MAG: hypothetical protein RIG62_16265 [Cyclobacteriaceae bacterium]